MADQANPNNPEGQQPSSPKQELRQHELVDKLVSDPSQQQSLTVLSGFLGQSQRAGYWRLYLTPTMDEYVEIPEEDIVHSQSLEPSQSALSETMVWVRSGASLQYTRTMSHQIQAEFLKGPITTGFRARAASFPASAILRAVPPTHVTPCLSDACGSDVAKYCHTVWCTGSRICGLTNFNCETQLCP